MIARLNKYPLLVALLALLALLPLTPAYAAVTFVEQAVLLASDAPAAGGDQFGFSVAIDGDTAVVGAVHGVGNVADSGAAYVFTRSGSVWTEQAKLIANDGVQDDEFGRSVAIDGDTVVIGAPTHDAGGTFNSGAAYVFVEPAGGWLGNLTLRETAKLTAFDDPLSPLRDHDEFGFSVSVSGPTVVVGAPFYDDPSLSPLGDSGAAYVFVEPEMGGWVGHPNLIEDARLTASDAEGLDRFGHSVAVSGPTVVVGAIFGDDFGPLFDRSGAAYVFVEPLMGGWVTNIEDAKLIATDGASEPQDGDEFGFSVSVSGNIVAVGAHFHDTGGVDRSGAAYVFVEPVGGWLGNLTLTEDAILIASAVDAQDHFGESVSVSGTTVVVGASGSNPAPIQSDSAYVFVEPTGGWLGNLTLSEDAILTTFGGVVSNEFGFSVAVSGPTVLVGAPLDDQMATNSGAAFVFTIEADLSVTKMDSPDPVLVADEVTYTITVSNDGPSDATGVILTDVLPLNVAVVSVSAGCNITVFGTVICDLGDLAFGTDAIVEIVVTPLVDGPITNTASVVANEFDPDDTDNTAEADTTVEPIFCEGLQATIYGTSVDDTIDGTSGDDVIVGLGGHDTIRGGPGKDTICGGTGNDRIDGGKGKDNLIGGDDNDDLRGGNGNDHLMGGSGDDTLSGGPGGNDTCDGGSNPVPPADNDTLGAGCENQVNFP